MREHARQYHELGFNVVPLETGGKRPRETWKHLQERRIFSEEIDEHFCDLDNIGIIMGALRETQLNILGVDWDSEEAFSQVYPKLPPSPMLCRTPHGWHGYYQLPFDVRVPNRVRIDGLQMDFRTQGGYLVAPPSFNREEGVHYEWAAGPVAAKDLPMFPPELLPKEEANGTPIRAEAAGPETIAKARQYLTSAGGAVSGEGGHRKTFRLACKLVHSPPNGFGLNYEEALALLLWWNPMCKPPWSERELTHKVLDAIKRAK